MSTMYVGWAETDITPGPKISLMGQFSERISEYIEKPLTATAMALQEGDVQAVIVSCDLLDIAWGLVEAVRNRLMGNDKGLDPRSVMIAAIHTHTGPVYWPKKGRAARYKEKSRMNSITLRAQIESFLPPGKKYVEAQKITGNKDIFPIKDTLPFLADRIAKVALEAWENRSPGTFANAFGRAALGMCRRAVYSDGSAQMWGETNLAVFQELEGGNDSGIELLFAYGENGRLRGIVANIACPAQCVQHRLIVSPDYWGEVKMRLRKYFGEDLFLLPLCSAAGDQCPVDLVRWVEPKSDVHDPNIEHEHPLKRKADPSMFDLEGMRTAGRRVAQEIIAVYEEGPKTLGEVEAFRHEICDIPLPLRRVTFAQRDAAVRAIREYIEAKEGDVNYNDTAKLYDHLGVIRRFDLQNVMDILETEVHILRLGPIAFATNPFELFLDYGNQIRARSKAEQTFLIQLCNGYEGYLPTLKAEKGGHYSAFVGSGQCGHEAGELLVRETLRRINDMFDE